MPAATDTRPTAAELRQRLLEAGDRLRELRQVDVERQDDAWRNDIRATIAQIHQEDALLTAVEAQEVRGRGPRASTGETGEQEYRTPGQVLTEDEGYRRFAEQRQAGARAYEFEIPGELRAPLDAGVLLPRGTPAVPTPRRRRMFVRDLIGVTPTTLSSVPYVRERNARLNEEGAQFTAPGTPKAEVTVEFEAADAPVRKITAWIPSTTEIIEDAPTLRGYIDGRLGYMLDVREEAAVLNGDGTGATILGIRNTPGLQRQAFVSDPAVTIGRAIGLVEDTDVEADGIVMRGTDFWVMATTRQANQFDGGIGGGNAPFGGAPTTLWGVPVVRTRAVPAGVALVGAFGMGATIFERQGVVVRVGNQHADFFTTNRVAILAEKRVGLAVERPDSFVEAALAAPTTP